MSSYIVVEKRLNLISGSYNKHDLVRCKTLDGALDQMKSLVLELPTMGYKDVESMTSSKILATSPLYGAPVVFEIRVTY